MSVSRLSSTLCSDGPLTPPELRVRIYKRLPQSRERLAERQLVTTLTKLIEEQAVVAEEVRPLRPAVAEEGRTAMRILGVDPGTQKMGYSIIDLDDDGGTAPLPGTGGRSKADARRRSPSGSTCSSANCRRSPNAGHRTSSR